MRALLLAAGIGTRLKPLTDTIPKCLVPVHGRPLMSYWLDLLCEGGVNSVLVNTHHLPSLVHGFVSSSPWRDRIRLVHEEHLLGTGGTILANREFFGEAPFIVAHADNLTRFDIGAFRARHASRPPNVDLTMMTFRTDDPKSCGIVEIDDAGVVQAFYEKVANPPGDLANGAVYIFEPVILDFLARTGKQVIDISTEVLPHFVGRILTFNNKDYHRDIGNPESLAKAQSDFKALV